MIGLADEVECECQHCAPGDDSFTARMRFHQSWYRRHVLGLAPGPNPAALGAIYGNMIRPADPRAGYNFLSPDIYAWTETRRRQDPKGLEPHRLRNNLLSSQPFCFNLFVPLAVIWTWPRGWCPPCRV